VDGELKRESCLHAIDSTFDMNFTAGFHSKVYFGNEEKRILGRGGQAGNYSQHYFADTITTEKSFISLA
jgi:hypothetical protein